MNTKFTSSRADQRALWQDWVQLWNGDLAQADRIVSLEFLSPEFLSPEFRVHVALLDGSSEDAIRGPGGLTRWIKESRGIFSDLKFTTKVGPLIDGQYIVGRWEATGPYKGGMPRATAAPGTDVTFTGTDILLVRGGKIVEYWLNADSASLLAQLGVQPVQ
jgi:SnoaL-like polyketide cyclase